MNSSLATLVLFLIAAMFLSQPQAKPQLFCCIRYRRRPSVDVILVSYEKGSPLCPQPAIIFLTKMNRRVCADPSAPWVLQTLRDFFEN
ncbi:C-C motif chemokine 4-like [Thamnophis elegans]|uniref:C-C motif chemokine 4-like n=1 Tax=Thamnophis elegans TaxID=35005 RepID=UPI001378781D|nr:C-C motif chemokine 4-like [Thamnophis elegans]